MLEEFPQPFYFCMIMFLQNYKYRNVNSMIFTGNSENLHKFIDQLNTLHPTLKFTVTHTKSPDDTGCDCEPLERLPFLDTALMIKDGKISSTLFRKPSDRNKYLLPSSCHPPHCSSNIPYSLALRIVRICSETDQRDQHLATLKEMLLERDYLPGVVNAAIKRALEVDRDTALEKVVREKDYSRPIFAVTYHPNYPSIPKIMKSAWRVMVMNDPHLREVFPAPPLVAYRVPPNLKKKLIRSKLPPKNARPRRNFNGMKKCRNCPICPFVVEGKTVKSTATNAVVEINSAVNCQTSNIIYCITCKKCSDQYIGTSERTLQKRFSEHRDYVKNEHLNKATGWHFNKKGHSVADMNVTIVEKVHSLDEALRLEREKKFIRDFNTKYCGINCIS